MSTTSRARGSSDDSCLSALAAREHPPGHPEMAGAARDDRPAVGVVDRRADHSGPAPARAADGSADPFDAEPSAPRAADEGDPEEVQGRQEAPAGRADEVLPREQHQSGGVLYSATGPASGLLRALPRSQALPASAGRQPLLARAHRHHEEGVGRLGAGARRRVRGEPARVELLHERRNRRSRPADHPLHHAGRLHPVHHQF